MVGYVVGSKEYEAHQKKRMLYIGKTKQLKDEGLSVTEIASKLNLNESTIRNYMNIITQAEANGYNK